MGIERTLPIRRRFRASPYNLVDFQPLTLRLSAMVEAQLAAVISRVLASEERARAAEKRARAAEARVAELTEQLAKKRRQEVAEFDAARSASWATRSPRIAESPDHAESPTSESDTSLDEEHAAFAAALAR